MNKHTAACRDANRRIAETGAIVPYLCVVECGEEGHSDMSHDPLATIVAALVRREHAPWCATSHSAPPDDCGCGARGEQAKIDTARERLRVVENERVEAVAILDWIDAVLRGEEVSDFAQSYGVVRGVLDLRRERDAYLARLYRIAERCRATPGPCFCEAHPPSPTMTTEGTERIDRAPPHTRAKGEEKP